MVQIIYKNREKLFLGWKSLSWFNSCTVTVASSIFLKPRKKVMMINEIWFLAQNKLKDSSFIAVKNNQHKVMFHLVNNTFCIFDIFPHWCRKYLLSTISELLITESMVRRPKCLGQRVKFFLDYESSFFAV